MPFWQSDFKFEGLALKNGCVAIEWNAPHKFTTSESEIFVCLPPGRNLIWPLESEPNRWNGSKGYFLEKRISRNQLKDRKKTHMISGLHIVPSRRLNLLTNFHVDLVRKYRSVEMTTTFVFLITDLRKTRPRLRVFEFDQLLSRGIRRTKYAL